jgi:hypothetical protein
LIIFLVLPKADIANSVMMSNLPLEGGLDGIWSSFTAAYFPGKLLDKVISASCSVGVLTFGE